MDRRTEIYLAVSGFTPEEALDKCIMYCEMVINSKKEVKLLHINDGRKDTVTPNSLVVMIRDLLELVPDYQDALHAGDVLMEMGNILRKRHEIEHNRKDT